jgi:hypothetical protein
VEVNSKIRLWDYYRQVFGQIKNDSSKNLISTIMACFASLGAAYLQGKYGLAHWHDSIAKALATIASGFAVLLLYFAGHAIRAPWKIHKVSAAEADEEIGRLTTENETLRQSLQEPKMAMVLEHCWLARSPYFLQSETEACLEMKVSISNIHRVSAVCEIRAMIVDQNNAEYQGHTFRLSDTYNTIDLKTPIEFGAPRNGWIGFLFCVIR